VTGGVTGGVRLAWELLRAEGARGLAERLAERAEALVARLEERAVTPERLAREAGPVPVLDVLASPLAPRWGGVPAQLGARRAEEARLRPTALLSPEGGRWTLRVTRGAETLRARLGPCGDVERSGQVGGTPDGDVGEAVRQVAEAARLVGARVVNVEGAAGWPPGALRRLAAALRTDGAAEPRVRLVVSLHDFALFCPRPNLVEAPGARFCAYSRDAERCRACLGATWSLRAGFVEDWRREAAALLAEADAVVYPSEFLRRKHRELFPDARGAVERVIAPPAPGADAEGPAPPTRRVGARRGEPARVAFVGAYRAHKGALVFEELLRTWDSNRPAVEWSILGSGDVGRMRAARGLGVRSAGHYRAGSLARRLREEEIDVALLLSVWPETYSLTLTECRGAGVPVVAFDLGAIGERIAADGGGATVSVENGAAGIATMLAKVLTGEAEVPPLRSGAAGASARAAAAERTELYRTLLGGAL
jgi:glycosyltransferase involved in cell wall biosynthesis